MLWLLSGLLLMSFLCFLTLLSCALTSVRLLDSYQVLARQLLVLGRSLSGSLEERLASSPAPSTLGLSRTSIPEVILEIILDLIRRGVIKLDAFSVESENGSSD